MNTDIDERIREAKSRIRQKQKLISMLRAIESQLISAERHQLRFKEILIKERADVRAIEGLSFAGIFHYLIGNRDQKLAIEQQEYISARLKLQESTEEVARLRGEVIKMQSELIAYEDAESQYDALLNEKEKLITKGHGRGAVELMEIAQQIDSLAEDERELDEAIIAGRRAIQALESVQSTLDSAGNWGSFDIFGGGMVATMIKHSKLDDARDQVRHTQQLLLRFERELADANHRLKVSLEIDGVSRFADVFFDGIVADLLMQSRIQRAQVACSKSIGIAQLAVRQCQYRLLDVQRESDELKKKRLYLLESSESSDRS